MHTLLFSALSMAGISGKTTSFLLVLSFAAGVAIGYKLKSWRIRYLRDKRGRLAAKLLKTQGQIEAATIL